jgi:hypothetical protein
MRRHVAELLRWEQGGGHRYSYEQRVPTPLSNVNEQEISNIEELTWAELVNEPGMRKSLEGEPAACSLLYLLQADGNPI